MKKEKNIVIKIGSSVLLTQRRKIHEFRLHQLVGQILSLQKRGYGVVLVVSGAVATGFRSLESSANDKTIAKCAAGIGWLEVVSALYRYFRRNNMKISQLLLTKDLLLEKRTTDDLLSIFKFYCDNSIIPVVNENDVVDLYSFGGNDELAFRIASLIRADKLVILSSQKSYFGYGGGRSKNQVIKKAEKSGLDAVIADGRKRDVLLKLL